MLKYWLHLMKNNRARSNQSKIIVILFSVDVRFVQNALRFNWIGKIFIFNDSQFMWNIDIAKMLHKIPFYKVKKMGNITVDPALKCSHGYCKWKPLKENNIRKFEWISIILIYCWHTNMKTTLQIERKRKHNSAGHR